MKDFKPKMRVQLLSPEGVVQSDRLVDQYTELNKGPEGRHEGPVKVEVTLFDEQSFKEFPTYLEKLRGVIPIVTKTRASKEVAETVNPYQEIYQAIKAKEHIEDIVDYLEEINFRFLSGQLIMDVPEKSVNDYRTKVGVLKPDFQYMVRVLKYAKDPVNDKFDFSLMVGVKFIGKPSEIVHIVYQGEEKAKLKRAWKKEGAVNMKKKKIPMVFPDYMTIEERKKWRYIRRKVENTREVSPKEQKFYDRYKLDIKNINEGKGFNL